MGHPPSPYTFPRRAAVISSTPFACQPISKHQLWATRPRRSDSLHRERNLWSNSFVQSTKIVNAKNREIPMKWCCKAFQGWFEAAGTRGIGVFVSMIEGREAAFILQHRALDPGSPVPNTSFPLTTVSDVHIHFCPWCGVRLKEFYQDTYQELERSGLRVPI